MKKRLLCAAVALMAVVTLTSCVQVDVVGKDAARAFKDALAVYPAQVESESSWYIDAPDGGARFYWMGSTVQMKIAVQPFIDAGLDISKLDNADDEWIYFANEFAMEPQTKSGEVPQFEYILSVGRSALGYHAAMDHYNISLGDGNVFEWAKDLQVNGSDKSNQDKDIVFVLNPEPLINAGVDPEKVEGWVYGEVTVDDNGKMVNVYKFLKPFDLK